MTQGEPSQELTVRFRYAAQALSALEPGLVVGAAPDALGGVRGALVLFHAVLL